MKGIGSNKAGKPDSKNGEERTKQLKGARKGSNMGDERLPCSYSMCVAVNKKW